MSSDISLYEYIDSVDVLTRLKPGLDSGALWIDKDTEKITFKKAIIHNVPWIYVKPHDQTNCFIWSEVLFTHFGNLMGNPPQGCQSCWKVVVRPRTLDELFKLKNLQEEMNVPCKCGIEARSFVHGLYGGYFYTRSLEEGLDRLDQVRKEVSEKISPEVKVFLKRGCTEMEQAFGDSEKWEATDKVKHWEQVIDNVFDHDPKFTIPQPDFVKVYVYRRWIDWAYSNGDETYKKFTNGKPLSIPYRKYERENL